MMEMQEKRSRPQNVYDNPNEKTETENEEARTEDLYQSLQTPPTVAERKAARIGKKTCKTKCTDM